MSMQNHTSNIYKHSMKLERRTASLYVQNTGCQQCSPGYGWGPGVRSHFLLHHVVGGGVCSHAGAIAMIWSRGTPF